MWKFQHPEGNREINELHVPAGRPVKVTLTSEDVIHSFYVPAFRIKQDALPGRYTTTWFQATKPGTYHLFCAEYCGTQHSGMGGWVVVMEPAQYEAWLAGDASGGSMAGRGEKLFNQLGCVTCHLADGSGRCPSLVNVYGRPVKLISGEDMVANDEYVRESILRPNAKNRGRLPADHADLPEPGFRRGNPAVDRLYQVARSRHFAGHGGSRCDNCAGANSAGRSRQQ